MTACGHWDSQTRQHCGAAPTRRYLPGPRCRAHTPAALANQPEPGHARHCPPAWCLCGHCWTPCRTCRTRLDPALTALDEHTHPTCPAADPRSADLYCPECNGLLGAATGVCSECGADPLGYYDGSTPMALPALRPASAAPDRPPG